MGLVGDLRFALRMMWANRGFTAVVLVALALGIGANTTVFTLANAVLFKNLPFPNGGRIVVVESNRPTKGETEIGVSLPDYLDWQAQSHTFASLSALEFSVETLSDARVSPQSFDLAEMSPNTLATIGVRPFRGRDFTPADAKPGAAPVVMVSYHVWTSVFGSDPAIIGRSVLLNRSPVTVIAVLGPGFAFPTNQDLWTPLVPTAGLQDRNDRELLVIGRMQPGLTRGAAQAEMNLVANRLERAYPGADHGVTASVMTFDQRFNGGQIRLAFLSLLGAVGCVLLIACANVSSLLTTRSLARAGEIAVRAALGADRARIVRQLLIESILLGCLGGLAGLGIAAAGVHYFALAVARIQKPYWISFSMNYTVFGYFAVICIATGLIFGIFPALHATRGNLAGSLKAGARASGGDRSAARFSRAMVVVELALSLLLLIGAGLMLRSFAALYGLSQTLPGDRIEVARVDLLGPAYALDTDRERLAERLLARLQSQPGVASAALASRLPLDGTSRWRFALAGAVPSDVRLRPQARIVVLSPGYFKTLQQPLLRGREFTDRDGLAGMANVIINRSFASRYLAGREPLRQTLELLVPPYDGNGAAVDTAVQVVGVGPDIHQDNRNGNQAEPVIYLPMRMRAMGEPQLLARGYGQPAAASVLRDAVHAVDPLLPVDGLDTLAGHFSLQRWPYRVFGTLFAVFAGFALALGAIGLYAVIAYAAVRRTREVGIRMALGSSRRRIVALIVADALWQIALGLGLGLAAAFAGTRVLASLLVGVTPTDPATFAVLSTGLAAVALLACLIPALRAAGLDPNRALRYE